MRGKQSDIHCACIFHIFKRNTSIFWGQGNLCANTQVFYLSTFLGLATPISEEGLYQALYWCFFWKGVQ